MSDRDTELAKADPGATSSPFDLSMILRSDSPWVIGDKHEYGMDSLDSPASRSGGNRSVHGEGCLHLSRSLLVMLKLNLNDGELTNVLCTTESISSSGILVTLPCRLGLSPGTIFNMDLFLGPGKEFVSVQGRARRIARIDNEDAVGYALEVEFYKVNMLAEKQIAAFVLSAQVEDHRVSMAQ